MNQADSMSRRTFVKAAGAAALATHLGATQAAPRETWQIGCYTRPWAQWDWRVAFDAIALAGFRHLGLMTTKGGLILSAASSDEDAAKVGAEARQRGLSIASAWCGDFSVAKSREAGVQSLRRMIDLCALAGVGNLLLGGVTDPRHYDDYCAAIAECGDQAAARNLGISIKPHGGLNATGPQCRKMIEKVGHRNFRLWYDPGNIFYYSDGKLDPANDAGAVDGLVAGMSIKDYRHPKNVDLTPGTGQVDFAKVMDRLKLGGFAAGPLIVETLAAGDEKQVLAEARKSRAFLEELTGST